jgi:hypothetical protein
LLQAVEHTTYYYENEPEAPGLPTQSGDMINHVFAFTSETTGRNETSSSKAGRIVKASYGQIDQQPVLVYDSTGCGDPYGYYSCDGPVYPDYDDSTYCCYTEEATNSQTTTQMASGNELLQFGGTAIRTEGCDYNGDQAGQYAYDWAFSNNPAYRVFDDDCTNFVSQAAYGLNGGWCYKGAFVHYKNWGLWWYNAQSGFFSGGQTRSWTQAKAMFFFSQNSGRGFLTPSICDMRSGDMIFASWNGDGVINHAMMVTGPQNCWLGFQGIYCSQHTPGRQGKSLQQYQDDEPNAKFYGVWICHDCL